MHSGASKIQGVFFILVLPFDGCISIVEMLYPFYTYNFIQLRRNVKFFIWPNDLPALSHICQIHGFLFCILFVGKGSDSLLPHLTCSQRSDSLKEESKKEGKR